jgi:hypothetical protein
MNWCFDAEGDVALGVRLLSASVPIFLHSSLMKEYRDRIERAFAVHPMTDGSLISIQLKVALAISLTHTGGTSLVVERSVDEIVEATQTGADPAPKMDALWAAWTFHANRGNYRKAVTLARALPWGTTLHYIGAQPAAFEHLQRVVYLATI